MRKREISWSERQWLPFTNGGLGKSTLFYLIKRFFINDFCIYSKYIRLCVRIHKGETVRYCVICTEGKQKLLKFLRIKSIKMGNVLAASVPPPPSPPPPTSGLLPNLEKPDSSETLNSSSRLSDGLKNPGTIEDLHKKCKGICISRNIIFNFFSLFSFFSIV